MPRVVGLRSSVSVLLITLHSDNDDDDDDNDGGGDGGGGDDDDEYTNHILCFCSFYSYIPHFPSPPSPSFLISLYIVTTGSGLSRDTSSTTKDSDDSNVLPPPAVPLPQERGGGNIQNIYAHRSPHPPPSKHFDHPSNHGGGRTAGGSGNSVVSQSQALSTPRDTGRDDHRPGRSHTTPALNKSSTPPRSGTSGGGATDGWGCRVCGAANTSDLEYCESCAHMRGSMGRKGSDQPIHRR